MENFSYTPEKRAKPESHSEPKRLRSPLSLLKDTQNSSKIPLTPLSKASNFPQNPSFILDFLEIPPSQNHINKLPLPLIVKPSISGPKNISQILHSFRSKTLKSNLKTAYQPSNKNVKFDLSTEDKENHTEVKTHSVATTSNSVTESKLDPVEEEKREFKYEEEVRASRVLVEFDEFPTVAFCDDCRKEVVTVVVLEKVRNGDGAWQNFYWKMCWCFPACLFSNTNLVHRCPCCRGELARIFSN